MGEALNLRRLAVIVADFGLSASLDEAILAAHRRGIVTITSLLVNMPDALGSLGTLSRTPGLGVGIHLNLTEGRPLCPPASVPSLTGGDGIFRGRDAAQSGVFLPEHVEMELQAQVEAFLATGLRPTHIDLHDHLGDPHVLSAAERLAHRLGVPLHLGSPLGIHRWVLRQGVVATRRWLLHELRRGWDGLTEVGVSLCPGDHAASEVRARETLAVFSDRVITDLVRESGISLTGRLDDVGSTAQAPQAEGTARSDYDRGYDAGYDAGFDRGFDQRHDLESSALRDIGYHSFLVEASPADAALPLGYGIGDLVREAARAVQAGRPGAPSALPVVEVHRLISEALSQRRGLSVITLAVESGASVPVGVVASSDIFEDALRGADIIGLPILHHFDRQSRALDLLFRMGLPVGGLRFTDSAIALLLHAHGMLKSLLGGEIPRRTLVISENPESLADALRRQGISISGTAAMPADPRGAPDFISTLDPDQFDLALVDGGPARLPVAVGIARRLERVALDVSTLGGHIVSGLLGL